MNSELFPWNVEISSLGNTIQGGLWLDKARLSANGDLWTRTVEILQSSYTPGTHMRKQGKSLLVSDQSKAEI